MRSIVIVLLMLLIGAAVAQDFVKGSEKGGPVKLSGLSPDIFDGAFFQSDGWTFDTTSYSLTPSQASFLKSDAKDGAPVGNVSGREPLRLGGNWRA